ncbi:hypothetical protein EUX98_g7045 [Antrodiella citrinella]|uniref:Uncharacterized protein n=1 Tax=Antrodiella citrinella TaxID=2447956 RepID=A0A4S4MUX9_9APHY|nr:hypothetical protein EUX98_g7045 [Antrodiella citrinella]
MQNDATCAEDDWMTKSFRCEKNHYSVNSASFSLASVSAHAAPTGDDNNTMNVDDTAFNDLLDDSGNAANVDDDALNSLMHSIDVGALNNGDSFTGPSSSFTPHLLHKAR